MAKIYYSRLSTFKFAFKRRKLNKKNFIYKYGFFKLSISSINGVLPGNFNFAYLLGVKYITAVVATSTFQFKNVYFFTLMISTIDYLYDKMTCSNSETDFYFYHFDL